MSKSHAHSQSERPSIESLKHLAAADPQRARELALAGTLILSSPRGYALLEEKIKANLQKVQEVSRGIGASNAADPDWLENAELLGLKVQLGQEYAVYEESVRALERTILFHEQTPGCIAFGSEFEATVLYPPADRLMIRKFVLLGPNEAMYGDRRYTDEHSGERFVVVSYLSEIGRAVWGQDVTRDLEQPIAFTTPVDPQPARILALRLLGETE